MDKSRKPTRAKPTNIKELSLPTLFEYGDTKALSDWHNDRKMLLKLINVAEAGTKNKSISTLPDLTTGFRGMGITTADGDYNGNDMFALPPKYYDEFWENDILIADDERLACLDGGEECQQEENEKMEANFMNNGEGKVYKCLGERMSKNELCRVKRAASVGTCGTDRNGENEKMVSVRQWVKDQSYVNCEPNAAQMFSINHEKLPEMNAARKRRTRVHSVSEESLGLRNKMNANDLLALNCGLRKESRNTSPELSTRLLEMRHRKTKAALTIEGLSLQTCDRGAMKVNTQEHDANNSELIEPQCDFARRCFTAFPIAGSLHEQPLNDENSSNQYPAICKTTSSNILTSVDITSHSSSRISWPDLGCGRRCLPASGRRCLPASGSPLRRKPTPRPPPLIFRASSSVPVDTKLSP